VYRLDSWIATISNVFDDCHNIRGSFFYFYVDVNLGGHVYRYHFNTGRGLREYPYRLDEFVLGNL
jgi:hypothetical protein